METCDTMTPAAQPVPEAGPGAFRRILDGQRLLAVFAAGMLLLNFPLLALWDVRTTVMNIPVFPVALFVLWGLLIGVVGWTVERMEA
jgi:hypothetical protein